MTASPRALEPKLWTVDDLAVFPEGKLVELYDGVLFEMPSPNVQHQRISMRLTAFLLAWQARQSGEVLAAPVDLYVSSTRYYIPDLVYYSQERLNQTPNWRNEQRLLAPPDLIIEIASPSTAGNDRVKKVRDYAAFGVPNYWLISPDDQSVQALVLRDGLYVISQVASGDEEWAPQLFPGTTISLSSLWTP